MEALIVTAHMSSGFAAGDPWSPALDAILAYWLMRERLGEEEFALQSSQRDLMGPVEGLPLGVEHHGEHWWYQCSSPIYEAKAVVRRHYHRRFDAHAAEQYLVPQKGRIQTQAGPYKSSRLSAQVYVTPAVVWHAIGDAAEVQRLLNRCSAIGAHIARGYGRVKRWTVEPGGDERLARFHRPLPIEFADAHGIAGQQMLFGIRPPARLPINHALCIMPQQEVRYADEA